MNVTLLRWTIEAALSSQVVSSGQYNTYVCSSALDVDVRMMYNPDLRMGSAALAMWSRSGTSNFRPLCIRSKFSAIYCRKDTHFGVYGTQFAKESHDFFSVSIDTDGFEKKIVQFHEVGLRDRRISAWRERIDESLERRLRDHDFINCGDYVSVA